MSNIIRNEIVGVNMKLIMSWIELCSRFSPRDVCCTVHWSRLMLLTIHWASVPRQTVISPSMSVCLSVFSTLWGWESTIPTPFISHKKIRQFRKSVFCLIRSFQINQLHLIASLYLVIPTRFLLFWFFFLVIRIYMLFMHQMIHFGHFECGVNLFVEVIFLQSVRNLQFYAQTGMSRWYLS